MIDEEPLGEGEGWQDWPAFHRVATTERGRIRFLVTPPGDTATERARIRQVAEHEYRIMSRLANDRLLRPRDMVDSELGVSLVYPLDDQFQRLDLRLADYPGLGETGAVGRGRGAMISFWISVVLPKVDWTRLSCGATIVPESSGLAVPAVKTGLHLVSARRGVHAVRSGRRSRATGSSRPVATPGPWRGPGDCAEPAAAGIPAVDADVDSLSPSRHSFHESS